MVSSYAIDDGERVLLFDPLSLPSEIEQLAAGREAAIVLTCPWHRRDAVGLAERLGAPIYVPPPDQGDEEPVEGHVFEAGEGLPFGVEAFRGDGAERPRPLGREPQSRRRRGRAHRPRQRSRDPGRLGGREGVTIRSARGCARCSSGRSSWSLPRTAGQPIERLSSARSPDGRTGPLASPRAPIPNSPLLGERSSKGATVDEPRVPRGGRRRALQHPPSARFARLTEQVWCATLVAVVTKRGWMT